MIGKPSPDHHGDDQISSTVGPSDSTVYKRSLSQRVNLYSLGLALVLIIAAVLRFHDLNRTSLWFAESVSWWQASLPFVKMIKVTAKDNYPPLHNIILHVTMALFGDSEAALRSPSALLGVATVYLIYKLGVALWDRMTGLMAAVLLAISGFHVWYSTEARMYALLAFTSTLFVLTVVYAVRRPNWTTLVSSVAAGTALLYSHVYGTFVFAGVNLAVIIALTVGAPWVRVSRRSWIVAQAISAVLFLPWAICLFYRARNVMQGFWIPEPTPSFALEQFFEVAGGLSAFLTFAGLGALSVISIPPCYPARGERGEGESFAFDAPGWLRLDWQNGLLLFWLIIPVFAGYLISVVGQPIFYHNYLISSLPAGLLLVARGIRSLSFNPLVSAMAFVIAVCVSLPNLKYQAFERLNDDHRGAMQAFSSQYMPSDRVFYLRGGWARFPSQYYYRKAILDSRRSNLDKISAEDIDVDRFWLVVLWDEGDKLDKFVSMVRHTHKLIYRFSRSMEPDKWPLPSRPMETRPGSSRNAELYLFEQTNSSN
jgi:hypothetical protein